jgi:regulatory protein
MQKAPAPKPVTARWLMNAAQFYLARYAASEAGLTAVLRRKAAKRAGAPPDAEALALIAETVAALRGAGLIDDTAFAAARTRTLQRKGLSAAGARQRLAAKGVNREIADAAIAEAAFDETAQVLAAARRLRIAAFSDPAAELSDRDKARLARRGFGPGAIRAALKATREGDVS